MGSIAEVRLENTNDNHYKFYEMTLYREPTGRYGVKVKYGRIGTAGKIILLRGSEFPMGVADGLNESVAKQAFLNQLKKKFRDKEYTLASICTIDEDLKESIEELQSEFDGYNAMAVRLENRSF